MRTLCHRSGLVALLVALAPQASAQCVAVTGGAVHAPNGVVESGTVLMTDGVIHEVGEDVQVPADCQTIDASGAIVTAGLIHPQSVLGLVEVGLESASVDLKPDGPHDPVHPSFEAHRGYNPDAVAIPVSRIAGVTSAVVVPKGGTFSGWSAWVDLAGESQAQTVKRPRLAQNLRLGAREGARGTALHRAIQLFEEARDYAKHRADWMKNKHRAFRFPVAELEAVLPVLAREVPLVVHADRASDIEAALRLGERYGIRLILVGATEAWRHAEQLATQKVPVILDPITNAPESFDRLFARADAAAILARAGVSLVLTTSDFTSHNLRKLAQAAGNAVRAGLPYADALAAITHNAADAFGMTKHGRLAPGAVGNVVVWSGDPLELSSSPKHVFIHGVSVPLISRQTRLRDRYRTLPGTPAPPLSVPSTSP
jgi:imidazolonepropionase-like amidohydrolase